MSYECPQCHSENVQRVSLVVSQGTKASSFFGIGGSTGGIGLGAGAGVTQTLQAQNLMPPKMRKVFWWALGTFLSAPSALSGFPVAIGIFLVCAVGLCWAIFYNKKEFPAQMASWQKLWICQRCANVFNLREFNG